MKQVGLVPVLMKKNSLLALCLLGGLSVFGIADAKVSTIVSYDVDGKIIRSNKNSKSNDEIKKPVAMMLIEDERQQVTPKNSFDNNAYYKDISKMGRFEVEKQLRHEVALAMVAIAAEGEGVVETPIMDEDKLAELIRKEVVKALSMDKRNLPKGSLGWVYLGRFTNNRWLGSPLKMGGKMPEKGKQYTISGDVNIRKGFSAFQPVTYVLQANTSVQLTDVVKRGNKGHYWAKVSML